MFNVLKRNIGRWPGSVQDQQDLGWQTHWVDVVNYQSIPNPDFPTVAEDDSYNMSKDQDYTLRMSHAIMSGIMPPGLPNEDPGLLSPARWGTMANRFMRKYVSTLRPSRPFRQIIFSIIHFWAPSWFQIKTHPRAIDGPRNLLKMVQYRQKLEPDLPQWLKISCFAKHFISLAQFRHIFVEIWLKNKKKQKPKQNKKKQKKKQIKKNK